MLKDYAVQIAKAVNGTVIEQEKANGVIKTGVSVPTNKAGISAQIYVDEMHKDGLTVDEAVEKIRELLSREQESNINLDFFSDFEKVKPLLRARLYNKATTSDVYRSASEYGLDDLIITAAVNLPSMDGSVKVKQEHLKTWGVSADELLDIAEENSKEAATLEDMADVLVSMGAPADMVASAPRNEMIVISNKERLFGAYSIIPMLDQLREIFPNGFTILPSSVHEVIAVPLTDDSLDGMVQDVNEAQVNPEEQLSNHAYRIAV